MAKLKESGKKPNRTRTARSTTRRVKPRQARESRAGYSTRRWKIPDVTPIGSPAPVSKTLPLAVKRIAETLDPDKIILFGSYAYGNPTPDSDVDLLVVMETSKPRSERYLTVSRLLRPRPFAVDILVKTPDEVTTAVEGGDFFLGEIVSQGKVLYERSEKSARLGSKSGRRL